jgi:hypothetical protein
MKVHLPDVAILHTHRSLVMSYISKMNGDRSLVNVHTCDGHFLALHVDGTKDGNETRRLFKTHFQASVTLSMSKTFSC